MEALRLTATALEGKLTVAVPDSCNNQEAEAIILRQPKEPAPQKDEAMAALHRRQMEHLGKAPLPHFPISKYDAYNQ